MNQFRTLARELAKKRGGAKIPPRPRFEHAALQDRIKELCEFREMHAKLCDVISRVLPNLDGDADGARESRDANAIKEVEAAYAPFCQLDILDMSTEGAAVLEAAKKTYNRRIDAVEGKIIEELTDRLGAARTADEMFRVFSRFNVLFFRHRIRAAIQQFQETLIQKVEADIHALQAKFKMSYNGSEAFRMSKLRDVPPVSGAIIWVKQIERRLRAYLDRVGAVLGKGWEQHVDGQRLQQLGNAFLSKLNTQKMFEQWMAGIQAAPSFEVTGHIFLVTHRRGSYALSVNFDPQIVELFKEVRNLQWLGFRIPYTLKMISEEAKEKYPFAMSLNTTMASYQRIITLLDPAYKDLVASYVQKVQRTVELSFSKGKGINWDSELLSDYTREFSSLVLTLQSKVDDLVGKYKSIKVLVDSLKTCEYTHEAFASILGEVQRIVDEMNLASYSNLQSWVLQLENDICTTLAQRLSKRVEAWKRDFEKLAPGNSDKTSKNLLARRMKRNASDDASSSLDGVAIAQRVHEIVLRKHALDLNPPLETSRLSWIGQLHDCVRTVCDQKPIRGNRYDDVLSAAESGRRKSNIWPEARSKNIAVWCVRGNRDSPW